MQSPMILKTLRTVALSFAAVAVCAASTAAGTAQMTKADTPAASPLIHDFEAVLTQALGTPTAAGSSTPASRAAVEAVLARTTAGMMP